MLTGKKGLVIGVANAQSIAWGCAKVFADHGAELALTYQNDKAKPYVAPLAASVNAAICCPLDVTDNAQMERLFVDIKDRWGKLDFLLHSIAFAPKADLQSRVVDCSAAGFAMAMDISCHSLIRLTKMAEPLMTNGGSILTMSYYGASKVVAGYNMMGPVKAALEAVMRGMAAELGGENIRVNALSPGPVKTRAASGLSHFDALMEHAAQAAPLHQLVTIEQIGEMAAFLVSDKAVSITGQTIFVDGGFGIVG